VDRPTNCSNDRQGLRRSKGAHQPKRNPKRGHIKKHTECFSCSRIYFDRLLPSCPHCGSAMVRHYNSEELNYLSDSSSADECVESNEGQQSQQRRRKLLVLYENTCTRQKTLSAPESLRIIEQDGE
jgi:hypothetical protein